MIGDVTEVFDAVTDDPKTWSSRIIDEDDTGAIGADETAVAAEEEAAAAAAAEVTLNLSRKLDFGEDFSDIITTNFARDDEGKNNFYMKIYKIWSRKITVCFVSAFFLAKDTVSGIIVFTVANVVLQSINVENELQSVYNKNSSLSITSLYGSKRCTSIY